MDKVWQEAKYFAGAVLVTAAISVVVGLFISVGYFMGKADVEQDWCISQGGMWLEDSCYESGQKVELK